MSVLSITKPPGRRGTFLGEFTTAADSIDEALRRALDIFHATANKALDIHLKGMPELGVQGNDAPYTVYIDGRPATGRGDIPLATRQVRFTFPLQAVVLSLEIMRSALEAEINARAPDLKKRNVKSDLIGAIRIWWGKKDGGVVEVSNASEIKDFQPGDWVAMVPDIPDMPFYNSMTRDKTGKGFMARTAARIKRTLRLRKGVGGIQIQAGRSRAIGSKMNIVPKKRVGPRPGRKMKVTSMSPTIYNTTAPAIFIRWRATNIRVN